MFSPKTRRQWAVAGVAALSTTTVIAGSTMPAVATPVAVPAQAAVGAEVFISEYVEGSSFNKGLEFFNPTDADIDLQAENYTVQVFSNGGATASATVSLEGTIPAKGTFILANGQATFASDQTGNINFNGDDAVTLNRDGVLIDSLGKIGEDPGSEWGDATVGTQNDTLRRMESVCAGDTDPTDDFDPSVEWVSFGNDAFDGLGSHTATCAPPAPRTPVINEFSADTTGTDTEYLEVFADADTDYSNLTILQVEGDESSSNQGKAIGSYAVGTTNGDGYFLNELASNTLQNGTLSLLLVSDYDGTDVLDADKDGVIDDGVTLDVVDSIAANDGDAGDLTYGGVELLPAEGEFAYGGASRIPNGVDTDAASDWKRNDFDKAGLPDGSPSTLDEGEALNTPGLENTDVAPVIPPPPLSCESETVAIGAVQGDGYTSPVEGETVFVAGVVTGDFQTGGFDGFYVQDEGDGNDATSDAIFVDTIATEVAPGDQVVVTGTAAEVFGMTIISDATAAICVDGTVRVEATEMNLPVTEDFNEQHEGMLMTLPQSLSILEYFNYGRFGQIQVGVDRQFQPTAIAAPGSPEAVAIAEANAAERIMIDDGRSSQNPDPAIHPNGEEFTLDNIFRGGDLVTNATGILDYRFSAWAIQPTEAADYEAVNERPAVPEVGGSTTVASFNVLNYFTTFGERGADNQGEFDRQEAKIVAALADLDADVVGLIEIENNSTAVETLTAALNDEVGADTYSVIETGQVGTDAITTALIYKSSEVTPVGDFATLTGADDARFLDSKNRPALAQTFEDNANGGQVTVVVNHLKSKGSSCDDVGDPEDPNGQGNCNGVRTDAAMALADWAAGDPTDTGSENTLIIGDLNSYDKEDPIAALQAAGYTDLELQFEGEEAYTYVFDGQLGYLDYAMSSEALTPLVTGSAAWNINADEVSLLDYDTSFKLDAQDAIFAPDPFRSSDHDPVLIGMDLVNDSEEPGELTDRISGDDRYATAAEAAARFGTVDTVYVASGVTYPDALAATPAAISADVPILLTKPGSLPPVTATAINELGATEVIIVGGTGAVNGDVATAIADATGANVSRIAGDNRYDTAAEIAESWIADDVDTVYLALGSEFADALAVGPLAGVNDDPILLTREGFVPDETMAMLEQIDPDEVILLGGEARISDEVLLELDAIWNVDRMAGLDRYETAAIIGAKMPASDNVYVASGLTFADALSGGALAGHDGAPLVLSRAMTVPDPTADFLVEGDFNQAILLGGTSTLTTELAGALEALLQ